MREETGYEKENLKEEGINGRLKRRKELIQKILIDKRIPNVQQKEQKKIRDFFSPKEKETQAEDPVEKGKPDLSRCPKKFKKSRKICWLCYSPITLKDFALITNSFSVGNWATLKQTIGKERLTIFIRECGRS